METLRRSSQSQNILKSILSYIYKKLSSIVTSIYILGAMALFYMIGTIFPQGENIDDYVKAGGKYIFLVRHLNLLDLFSSAIFLVLAASLLLNLIVCSYARYPALFTSSAFSNTFEPTSTFCLTQDMKDAVAEVKTILTHELGFRPVTEKKDAWTVMEKGPRISYRWLTWIYHAGIIVCFAGILLTYLFAFEGDLTLKPHVVSAFSPDGSGRINGLFQSRGGPAGFSLLLVDFIPEYTQSPHLDYPKNKLSRLAVGLGWKTPYYRTDDQSMSPRAWQSKIKVMKGGLPVYEKAVDVNDPLRYGGYTFYQEGYEQTLKIQIDDNPILLETGSDEDLFVPGLDAAIKLSPANDGILHRLDGGVEDIKPATVIKREIRTVDSGEKKYEVVGKIELGESVFVDGRRLTLAGVVDSPIFSYRYDPGVKILWWAGIAVLSAMCLRFFAGWYLVAYRLCEKDGIVSLELNISTRGLGANGSRLAKRVESLLTRNDILPSPLHPSIERPQ